MYLSINYRANQNISMQGNLSKIEKAKYIPEKVFDGLVKSLPKTESEIIDICRLDAEDKKSYEIIEFWYNRWLKSYEKKFSGSIKNLKEALKKKIINTHQEVYNGTSAKVTKNLAGQIVYVDIGAKTESEAVKAMGLKKAGTYNKTTFDSYHCMEGYHYNPEEKGTPLYIAEFIEVVEGKSQPRQDYFIWNPDKRVMEFRKLVNS